jgi:hypothetical protein
MPKLSHRCAITLLSLTFLAACTPGEQPVDKPVEDGASKGDDKQPDPVPEPVAVTKISVASVQMIEDCPDPEPPPPAAEAEDEEEMPAGKSASQAKRGASLVGDNSGSWSHCEQSTVQLGLETAGEAPVSVEIKAVRLLSDAKSVGSVQARKPTIWVDNNYQTWDQQVAPGAPTKASYKLSLPNWTEVEAAIGKPSFGHMFTLEIDIEVDGKLQTVSSPQFPREEPHVVVT